MHVTIEKLADRNSFIVSAVGDGAVLSQSEIAFGPDWHTRASLGAYTEQGAVHRAFDRARSYCEVWGLSPRAIKLVPYSGHAEAA